MSGEARPRAHERSIQSRVMTLVAAGLVATVAIFGTVSWRAIRNLERDVDHVRVAVAGDTAHHVEELLTSVFSVLQGVAGAARSVTTGEPAPEFSQVLREASVESPLLSAVALIDRTGSVAAAEPPGVDRVLAQAPEARALVASALASDRPLVSNLLDLGSSERRLLLVVQVRDWHGVVTGVVVGMADARTGGFERAIQALLTPSPWPIDIVDGRGRTVASSRAGRFSSESPSAGRSATAALRVAPWEVAVYAPAGIRSSSSFLRSFLWLVPLLAAFALLFGWGAGRSVRVPLLALDKAAARIAGGDLENPITTSGEDEVGRLGRSFERMRVALKASLDEVTAANEALERRVEERTRELAAANRELNARERVRQQLLRKVISAQEDERKRLARELHDETSQTLTALSVRLETALANTPQEPARTHVAEARALASRSLDELQRLMHDLRPSVLDDLGLVSAIRWYAERHLASRGISVRFEASPPDLRLPYDLETALFRATQEILTNVARHADADMVLIQLSAHEGRLSLEVEDDGRGFNPAEVRPSPTNMRGLGLMGIRERVELFDGSVEFDSSPGQGTRVAINVPLPPGASRGEDPRPHR